MDGVDLIFQIRDRSPNCLSRNPNKHVELKHSKGIVKNINKAYTETKIKNMLGADQHGISHVKQMRNRQNQITTTVRITFSTKIAPIKVGTEETGYYNVEPSFYLRRFSESRSNSESAPSVGPSLRSLLVCPSVCLQHFWGA